jgi:nucleoid-associated protein YgaU
MDAALYAARVRLHAQFARLGVRAVTGDGSGGRRTQGGLLRETSDIETQIDKVDRFYAAKVRELDEFYGKRIDHLLDQLAILQNVVDALARRIDVLEHK